MDYLIAVTIALLMSESFMLSHIFVTCRTRKRWGDVMWALNALSPNAPWSANFIPLPRLPHLSPFPPYRYADRPRRRLSFSRKICLAC